MALIELYNDLVLLKLKNLKFSSQMDFCNQLTCKEQVKYLYI